MEETAADTAATKTAPNPAAKKSVAGLSPSILVQARLSRLSARQWEIIERYNPLDRANTLKELSAGGGRPSQVTAFLQAFAETGHFLKRGLAKLALFAGFSRADLACQVERGAVERLFGGRGICWRPTPPAVHRDTRT